MRTITGQDTKPIARREAIEACVRTWIRNNPEEFKKFVEFVKNKKKRLVDPEFGRSADSAHTFQEEFRVQGQLPPSLSMAINELCRWHGQDSLFQYGSEEDRKAEAKWFLTKFNVFRVSEKL